MTERNDSIDLYAVLGHPVAGLRSPRLFGESLEERGMGGHMVPLDVPPSMLETFLHGFKALENLRGFLVTMPHKQTIVPLLDDLTPTAQITGAVNIVRRTGNGRLVGGQLDGPGFVAGLIGAGFVPQGAKVFMLGAGGVAAGIAYALADAGVTEMVLANRSRARAEKLAARLDLHFPDCEFSLSRGTPDPDVAVAINATSVGLAGETRLPFAIGGLRGEAMVADVVNRPEVTALIAAAQGRGLRTLEGGGMVIPQLSMMHDFFA